MNEIIKKIPKINIFNDINKCKNINEKGVKVYIPYGKKYLAWFTKYDGKCCCILIKYIKQYDKEKGCNKFTMTNPRLVFSCFKDILTLGIGTIFYGTIYDNTNFIIEQTPYLKGEQNNINNFYDNIDFSKNVISDYIKNVDLNNIKINNINFYLPTMSYSRQPFLESSTINYMTYQIVDSNSKYIILHNMILDFKVTNTQQNDVYNLYTNDNNKTVFFDTAFINDFKTSHIMNMKFKEKKGKFKYRNYIDNEMSDYEDDEVPYITIDEKNNNDIFVEKELTISCLYIPEKNKWKPYKFDKNIGISATKEKIRNIINKKYFNNI